MMGVRSRKTSIDSCLVRQSHGNRDTVVDECISTWLLLTVDKETL